VAALPVAADERARRTREGAAVHLARPRCGWEATVEVLTKAETSSWAMGDIVGTFEDENGIHGFRGTPAGRLLPDDPAE
jgi:hypothetical protein